MHLAYLQNNEKTESMRQSKRVAEHGFTKIGLRFRALKLFFMGSRGKKDDLLMFVVYNNPADFPGETVVRKYAIDGNGQTLPCGIVYRGSIEYIGDVMSKSGRAFIPRHVSDDDCIIGTYI
jgi:hypothetical protein